MSNLHVPPSKTYLALGDSIATGANNNDTGYPKLIEQKLSQHYPVTLELLAANGQTSRQLMRSLPKIKDQITNANIITLNIGGNDLRIAWKIYAAKPVPSKITRRKMQVTLNTLTNNLNQILTLIKSTNPHARLIILNLYNPYAKSHPETNEYIAMANAQIQNLCSMLDIELLDIFSLLNQKSGRNINQFLSDDKIHLNQVGQETIADAIYRRIQPFPWWKKLARFVKIPVSK